MVKWSDWQEQLQNCFLSNGVAIAFAGENSVISDVRYSIDQFISTDTLGIPHLSHDTCAAISNLEETVKRE